MDFQTARNDPIRMVQVSLGKLAMLIGAQVSLDRELVLREIEDLTAEFQTRLLKNMPVETVPPDATCLFDLLRKLAGAQPCTDKAGDLACLVIEEENEYYLSIRDLKRSLREDSEELA